MNLKSAFYLVSLAALVAACSNADELGEMAPSESLNSEVKMSAPDNDLFARRNGETLLTGAYTDPSDYSHYYNDPVIADHASKLMCEADTNMAASLNSV